MESLSMDKHEIRPKLENEIEYGSVTMAIVAGG